MAEDTNTGTGGAGSTDAGTSGQQPNSSQQQTPANTSGQSTSTQQTSSQAPGQTGQPTAFIYKEDRSDWMPRHRFNEASTKAQTLESQLAERDRQIAALTGNAKPDASEQKAAQIKDAFFALPGMGVLKKLAERMTEDQIDSLLEVPNQVSASRQAEMRQWERHGNEQLNTVAEKVAEAIGSDSLDDDQKSDLRTSMSSWIKARATQELQQAVDRYGEKAVSQDQRRFSETIRRYEDGDVKLLDEFVTRYTKNWVEPARRSATARTFTRTRPVPDSGGRTPVTSSIKRPNSFKSLDERIDFAANLAKERGVQFGR